jgi:putative DNA primase/helicase
LAEALKAAAFEWWKKGFVVVPIVFVREPDGDLRKQPLVEWKRWQNEEQTLQDFESLPWDKAEGIAVLCGKPNKDGLSVGVMDFDVKKTTVEAQARGREVMKRFRVTTREGTPSGGEHLVFLSRKPVRSISEHHDSAALELLGENKLCVMYPSIGYSKINDNFQTVVDDLESEFLEALKRAGVKFSEQKRRGFSGLRPCFKRLMEKQELGHDERVALVNELEHQGFSIENVKEIFHQYRAWETSYDPQKTNYQIQSVYGKYGHFSKTKLQQRKICFEECERFSWPDCRQSPVFNKYFVDGKFVPMRLAEELMQQYCFITMRDNEQMYVWQDGYYRPYAESLIKEECKLRLGEEYRTNRVSEVIDYIKASTFRDRREEPPHLIPLKNGVLDINTMELKSHSPSYMFFNLLPVEYNADAKCPKIEKFLSEVAGCNQDVEILLEVIGFCLYREYFIAKALMLAGEGSNGKSTFLNLVKTFLGKENVSGRSLQDLEDNRFAKADMHHKLANIYADLPDRALWRTGTFKMLTGRDLIAAERKFQQSFTYENYAKLLFSANKVPEAYDDTEAFFRRWIIVVFPNQFANDKADPYILQKLTAPEELSGLLNLAIQGLKHLLKNGTFSYSKTTEQIKEDYIRKSSPVAAFIMDCMEVDSDAFIEKKELYVVFAEYCRVRGLPTVSQDSFFKKLPSYVQVADFKPVVEGKRLHTFKGLRYKAEGWSLSNLSNVSRVFYTLSEKSNDYKTPYNVVELKDSSYIKVDVGPGQAGHLGQEKTLKEKLEQLKTWLIENKDYKGLVDAEALARKIKELDLDVQKIVQLLKDEYWIRDVPDLGKWGVK